ncbi:MAG TPA: oxygenase MpaB family protein [Acidimicrobiales bacterium]|nr:oxygenase MpaB family protein [Acidimicrobiales bacterium]
MNNDVSPNFFSLATYRDALQRRRLQSGMVIRRSVGLDGTPPPRCDDPRESFCEVDGVARIVHRELPSMLVGGLGSLFFQMLHPLAMAGVADHSRYQEDPLARLLSTANFISATTFGSRDTAHAAIDRVLNVHQFVHGTADDGRPYDANDPHLLLWVHCAEVYMFLNAFRRFGSRRLSDVEADRYVEELAPLAEALGVERAPRSVRELEAGLLSFRNELRLSADGEAARDFIAYGLMESRTQRLVYRLMVLGAWALLPRYAQERLGISRRPLLDRLLIQPATSLLCAAMRLAMPRAVQVASVIPPSTATT